MTDDELAGRVEAYVVTEEFENNGGIIFAKHAVVARRHGADEYADGDFSAVSCRRANWADHCADTGVVPASLMVWHGWHFECTGCGARIDSDFNNWQDRVRSGDSFRDMLRLARRYSKWTPDSIVGSQNSMVFCDQQCEIDHHAHEAERARRQQIAIDRFKSIILRRFPDAKLIDEPGRYRSYQYAYAYQKNGRWRIGQVRVPFEYPGAKYGPAALAYNPDSSYRGDQHPHYTCAGGDKEAFQAYAALRASKDTDNG